MPEAIQTQREKKCTKKYMVDCSHELRGVQAAPDHGMVLRPNGGAPYTSLQLDFSQPALPATSAVLALSITHPRVVLLARFVEDILYAADTLQVGPFLHQYRHCHKFAVLADYN